MLNDQFSLLADQAYMRRYELVSIETTHHHIKQTAHILLQLTDALHVQVTSIQALLNCGLQSRIEIEQTQKTMKGTLPVKGFSIGRSCCLNQ
jgi:hypothetical protein